MVYVDAHCAIAMRTMKRAAGSVDGDQVVIHSQAVTLRVTFGKELALQHL